MEKHEFVVKFICESESQILIQYLSNRLWLPKSDIGYITGDADEGETITITVPHPLARLKGMA